MPDTYRKMRGLAGTARIWAKHGGVCHLCRNKVARSEASRDHRVPRQQVLRPPPRDETVLLAHLMCNHARGDLPLNLAYEAVGRARAVCVDRGVEFTAQRAQEALHQRLKQWKHVEEL